MQERNHLIPYLELTNAALASKPSKNNCFILLIQLNIIFINNNVNARLYTAHDLVHWFEKIEHIITHTDTEKWYNLIIVSDDLPMINMERGC